MAGAGLAVKAGLAVLTNKGSLNVPAAASQRFFKSNDIVFVFLFDSQQGVFDAHPFFS